MKGCFHIYSLTDSISDQRPGRPT